MIGRPWCMWARRRRSAPLRRRFVGFLPTLRPARIRRRHPTPLRWDPSLAGLLLLGGILLPVAPAASGGVAGAQQAGAASQEAGWNSPEALELIDRGRAVRARLVTDGELQSYEALTEGHIYFFLDPEVGERALIRIDQVAVQLRWAAPDRIQQHIVGERSETRLPVQDFRYYLDRLTLVQYGFGDEIRIGSGLDVAGVPHPLARLHPTDRDHTPYDFRIADSLSLSLPGRPEPLRLYEIEVRPTDPTSPGILGTITLDRASAGIARMAFTFTPASYVDPRTDRIAVELDYGLWEGRYWLPNLQRIEVRREIPEIDLAVGTVIRTVLRTSDYRLNVSLPESFRELPSTTQLPRALREEYPFVDGLYGRLERDGLARLRVDVDPRQLRAEAAELVQRAPPSGLRPLRFHLPRVSSGLRYSRSEGLFFGMGASFRPDPTLRLRGRGGYALGAREMQGALSLERALGPRWTVEGEVQRHGTEDLGLTPGIDPLLSTLSAAIEGEDYQDPYRFTGGDVRLTFLPAGASTVRLAAGFHRVRSLELQAHAAPLNRARAFRPVRPIADGDFLRLGLALKRPVSWPAGGAGWGELATELLSGGPGEGVGLSAAGEARWGSASGVRDLTLHMRGWTWWGDALPQGHRLIGGRGTLPGFPYRAFLGQATVAGSLEASADARGPLLRVRGGLHAAWADGGDPQVAAAWQASPTDRVRVSLSTGVGFPWDIVRLDLARGLGGGGEWQLLISVDPLWWDRL